MTVRRQLLIAGSVRFLGETRAVPIYLTDSDDALIGAFSVPDSFLCLGGIGSHCRLAINCAVESG